MVDINTKTFTIFNVVDKGDESNPSYGWRFFVNRCNSQKTNNLLKGDNTEITVNSTTIFCYDFKNYLCSKEYYKLDDVERINFFTLAPHDLIVFDVVTDEINHDNVIEWQELKDKYKNNSITASEVKTYINGLSTDHLEVIGT